MLAASPTLNPLPGSGTPEGDSPVARVEPAERLVLLDDPQEWSAFSRPVDQRPSCWESSVVFEGMHCAACALTIEDALRAVPGVESVRVSAATHRGRIVWSDGVVKPSGWMQAARRAGYPAVPANDAFANDRRKAELRKAVWRMGVAGLCMMQVMMYAWPAYVAAGRRFVGKRWKRLLRWASWVISLTRGAFLPAALSFTSALRDLYASGR
jgi:Cu2+-exporting ATPase